jgi:hypothetical protein
MFRRFSIFQDRFNQGVFILEINPLCCQINRIEQLIRSKPAPLQKEFDQLINRGRRRYSAVFDLIAGLKDLHP